MWKNRFECLCNSVYDTVNMNRVHQRLELATDGVNHKLVLSDIHDALNNQIKGKAAGPDGTDMEAYIYGGHRLKIHVCLLFNACISHGYLPHAVMECVILPLIKNKGGNLNDADNYRAIAISNAVVRQYCRNTETKDQARMYQFMRDLIACRDWYDRDSGCILSRDELCDIINFLAASLIDVCFLFIACFLYF